MALKQARLHRRTVFKLGAATLALAALAGGWAVHWRRRDRGLSSAVITGEWQALGPGIHWLLPNLDGARVVVPDRPHRVEETRDPELRARIRRTRSFLVNTNARRLRGEAFSDTPAVGTTRILAIGDSVTFGWGVSQEEAWPARLQQALRARGRSVEVLNAGVPALRLEGLEGYLTRIAPSLGPAAVLFARRPYPQGGDPLGDYARTVRRCMAALPKARFLLLLPPISRFDLRGREQGAQEAAQLAARLPEVPLLDLTPALRSAQGQRGCTLVRSNQQLSVTRLETGETLLRTSCPGLDLPDEVYELLDRDSSVREALFFDSGHPDAAGLRCVAAAAADMAEPLLWKS